MLRRWEIETQKFNIKQVDKYQISTVKKDFEVEVSSVRGNLTLIELFHSKFRVTLLIVSILRIRKLRTLCRDDDFHLIPFSLLKL